MQHRRAMLTRLARRSQVLSEQLRAEGSRPNVDLEKALRTWVEEVVENVSSDGNDMVSSLLDHTGWSSGSNAMFAFKAKAQSLAIQANHLSTARQALNRLANQRPFVVRAPIPPFYWYTVNLYELRLPYISAVIMRYAKRVGKDDQINILWLRPSEGLGLCYFLHSVEPLSSQLNVIVSNIPASCTYERAVFQQNIALIPARLKGRVIFSDEILEGDYAGLQDSSPYDLIVCEGRRNPKECCSQHEALVLLRRAFHHLRRGGILMIDDQRIDDDSFASIVGPSFLCKPAQVLASEVRGTALKASVGQFMLLTRK